MKKTNLRFTLANLTTLTSLVFSSTTFAQTKNQNPETQNSLSNTTLLGSISSGDLGTGGGIQFNHIERSKIGKGAFDFTQDQSGNQFLNFHLEYKDRFGSSDKNPENNWVSDLIRAHLTPFKTEFNTAYGLATLGYLAESSDGSARAMLVARPLTFSTFKTRNGPTADVNVESAIDLSLQQKLGQLITINADGTYSLGWGASANSSECKLGIECKLGESTPWGINLEAVSQRVAFKHNSQMVRDGATQVRLGVSYSAR